MCSGFFFVIGGVPPQSLRDSSPKGAPFGTAAKFPATAKSRPLGEGGIAVGDDGRGASPQRRAFAESGAANAIFLYDPSREKVVSKRPQAFRNYK